MRNITSIVILILALLPLKALANNEYYSENIHSYSVLQQDSIDNLPFRGEIYNKEYEVSICFDFYKKKEELVKDGIDVNISIPNFTFDDFNVDEK